MTQMDAPSGNPGGRDLPDTPATPADVLRWACDVGWSSPFVDVSQARDEEWGSIRVVFAEVTETSLTITLDNGQVFRLAVVELTRPSGLPGRPFTLNPAGQLSTHASVGSAPLCGQGAAGEMASLGWAQVTCLDCQAAAPARGVDSLDDLDLAMAAKQVRDVLTAASPEPLPLYEVMRRVDPGLRAAVQAVLTQMVERGTAERTDGPNDGQPTWRVVPAPS